MDVRLLIYVLFYLSITSSWFQSSRAYFFVESPTDLTVYAGGDVKMWCTPMDDISCRRLNWIYSESTQGTNDSFEILGTCRTPVNHWNLSRFDITFEDGRYGLHISNVTLEDAGQYGCLAFVPVPIQSLIGFVSKFSSIGALRVTRPLPRPQCRMRPESAAINGEVQFICEVPESTDGKPVRLTWFFESLGFRRSLSVDPGITFTQMYRLLEYDNYGRFICIAGLDQYRGPNCTLVPLQVPMNVTLRYVAPKSGHQENSPSLSAVFACDAEAVPAVTKYQWTVVESDSSSSRWNPVKTDRIEIVGSGETLLVSKANEEQMLMVSCTASNEIGMNKTSEPVIVLFCSNGSIVTDQALCHNYLSSTVTFLHFTPTTEKIYKEDKIFNFKTGVIIGIIAVLTTTLLVILSCLVMIICKRSQDRRGKVLRDFSGSGRRVAYSSRADEIDARIQPDANSLTAKSESETAANLFRISNGRQEAHGDRQNITESQRSSCHYAVSAIHSSCTRQMETEVYSSIDGYPSVGKKTVHGSFTKHSSCCESATKHIAPSPYLSVDISRFPVESPSRNEHVVYPLPDKTKQNQHHSEGGPPLCQLSCQESIASGKFMPVDSSHVVYAMPEKGGTGSAESRNRVSSSAIESSCTLDEQTYAKIPKKSGDKIKDDCDEQEDDASRNNNEDSTIAQRGSQSLLTRRTGSSTPMKPQRSRRSLVAGSQMLKSKISESQFERQSSDEMIHRKNEAPVLHRVPDK